MSIPTTLVTTTTPIQAVLARDSLRFAIIVCPLLAVYDCFLTLELEVTYIWTSPWSIIKVLYLYARYMPIIDTTFLTLYRDYTPNLGTRTCSMLMSAQLWLYVIGMALAEAVFCIRSLVMWRANRILVWTLGGLFAAFVGVVFYTVGRYGESFTFVPGGTGCVVSSWDNIEWVDWLVFVIVDAVLLSLVLVKTYTIYRRECKTTKLIRVILRDGICYFVLLIVLVGANEFVARDAKVGVVTMLVAGPARVLYSIAAVRMILHFREAGSEHSTFFTASHAPITAAFSLSQITSAVIDSRQADDVDPVEEVERSSQEVSSSAVDV